MQAPPAPAYVAPATPGPAATSSPYSYPFGALVFGCLPALFGADNPKIFADHARSPASKFNAEMSARGQSGVSWSISSRNTCQVSYIGVDAEKLFWVLSTSIIPKLKAHSAGGTCVENEARDVDTLTCSAGKFPSFRISLEKREEGASARFDGEVTYLSPAVAARDATTAPPKSLDPR